MLNVIAVDQGNFGYLSTTVTVLNNSRKAISRDVLEGFHDAIFPSIKNVVENGDTFLGMPLITNLSKLGDSLGRDVKEYHLARGKTFERRGTFSE